MRVGNGVNLDPGAVEVSKSARWPALIGFAFTLLTLLATQYETEFSLYVLWSESFEYGHGLLVAPISAYLLWLRRDRLSQCPIEPGPVGVVLTALFTGLWLLSHILGILIGEQITFVLLLIAIIHAVLGLKMARLCAVPILFLYLAVPFWSYLIPFLQATSATSATVIVRGIGIPVFNEGLYLTIPGGRFLVAEVCSGLRYLLASLTLGTLFAVMNLGTFKYRAIIFITGICLGIVFNWIRVAMIVASGHFLGMDSILVHKHVWLGWVLFVVVSVLLVAAGNFFQNKEELSDSHPLPDVPEASGQAGPPLLPAVYSLLCIGILTGSAWLAMAPAQASVRSLDFNLGHIGVEDYQLAVGKGADDWSADFKNADAVDQKNFTSAATAIDIYVAYYQRQRQGAEVVNDSNALFDVDVWTRTALRPKPDQVQINQDLLVDEFIVLRTDTQAQRLIWRVYWISGHYTSNGLDAKLKQVLSLVQGRTSAAGIVLSTPVAIDREQSRRELKNFLKTNLEPISRYLSALE